MILLGLLGVALPTWAFGPFLRPANVNPVIAPREESRFLDPMTQRSVAWESNDTFNPGATVRKGKIVVLYRAEDRFGEGIGQRTSRLGFAESKDGLRFVRQPVPVLFPGDDDQKEAESPGGCEDPRVVVREDGTYEVFYTQWNRKRAQLAVATSSDLVHWKKYGSIFRHSTYHPDFFKSASPITEVKKGRQTLARIDGKYWMYWGEQGVFAATSSDGIDWRPILDGNGKPKVLFSPRRGRFDSVLTECGPPAVRTKDGIVLLYNGKNGQGDAGDPRYPSSAYCAGQALFDPSDPLKLVGRLDEPFFKPEEAFEKSGQYVAGTVFTEGLVFFKGKWFLYYGCADSRVGVAVFDPKAPKA